MKNVNDIFNWLKKKPNSYMIFVKSESGAVLYDNLTFLEIENEFGSEQNFLSKIAENNNVVEIQRRYGTSRRKTGKPIKVRLTKKDNVGGNAPAETVPGVQPTQHGSKTNNMNFSGMAHPGMQAPGLGQFIEASNKAALSEEIKRQRDKFEAKLEVLEKDNEKLERENDDLKRQLDTKPDVLSDLLGKVAESGQMGKIIEVFVNGKGKQQQQQPQEALNAPKLSATKREFVEVLKDDNVDDKLVQKAFYVIHFALQGNQDFINDYQELIKKHSTPSKTKNNVGDTN